MNSHSQAMWSAARVGCDNRTQPEREVVARDVGELLRLMEAVVRSVLGLAGADQPARRMAEQAPEAGGEAVRVRDAHRRKMRGRRARVHSPRGSRYCSAATTARNPSRAPIRVEPLLRRRLKPHRQHPVHDRARERGVERRTELRIGIGAPQIELACVLGRTWIGSSTVVRKISRPLLPNAMTVSL